MFGSLFENVSNILSYINPFDENFLGRKIIELLGDLLKNLFVPKEDFFNNTTNELKTLLSEKIPYEAYLELFENVKDVSQGDPAGLNINFNNYKIGNKEIATGKNWIKFDMILKYKQTWFQWCRGFTYIFFIIYNLNQLIKFLRGFSVADGSAISSTLSNKERRKKVIVELICGPLIFMAKGIINMLPILSLPINSLVAVINLLMVGLNFFPIELWIMVIGSIVFWFTINFIIGLISFVVKLFSLGISGGL